MNLSEKEAKTKWCPFARLGINRWNGDYVDNERTQSAKVKCIASECALWNKPEWSTCGHCGLGGKP
jgi:hypothetical protein